VETSLPHLAPLAGVIPGAVLVAGGGLLCWPALAVARRLAPEPQPPRARWGYAELGGVLAVAVVATLALPFLWPLPEGDAPLPPLEGLLRMGVLYVVSAAAIAAVVAAPGAGGGAGLGVQRRGSLRAAALGGAVYPLLLPALLGITALWVAALERLTGEVEAQRVLVRFLELHGSSLVLGLVLGILVLPFGEELVFRGFVQPVLVRTFGGPAGVAATSLLFASMHGLVAGVPVFALSLLLGAVMLRTQRLAASWTVHVLHNGTMLALLLSDPDGVDRLVGGLLGAR